MFQNILVPVDLSDNCKSALRLAKRLAGESRAGLTCLFVVPEKGAEARSFSKMFKQADSEKNLLTNYALPRVESWIDELDWLDPEDIDISARVGKPVDVILEFTEENQQDLVVMGTHGRSGFRRLWIGSVAERVVRTCPVPVMVVRPEDKIPGVVEEVL